MLYLELIMIKHNVGVQPKTTIEIKKLDEDFFVDEGWLHSFYIPVAISKMIEIPMEFKIKIKLQRVVIFEVPRIFI